jgi:putative membrane protein
MKTLPLVSLIAALGVAVSASAQDRQAFVSAAAQDGMTEVELGKMASSKSQRSDVKEFADRMVQDHGKANSELEALAKSKNLQVPKKLDAEHQSMVDRLRSKSGTEFDTSYAQHMAADHAKAITLFEDATKLEDKDISAFAQKTLPTLKEHKRMADRMNARQQ